MTERLSADQLGRAAEMLRAGRLVAFPTETVYGLGGASRDAQAVAGIFAAKGRPSFNPLISHFPDAEAAFAEAVADDRARAVARAFWPGPLTLVLPRAADSRIALLASAGLPSLALRVPAHPMAQALLRAAGQPIAAPSANRSGGVSPTTADHVLDGLSGQIDAVLDGGPCAVGLESTVLDLTGPVPLLLRPGGIPEAELEKLLGPIGRAAPAGSEDEARPAPGMLSSHYAPSLPVRLEATTVAPDEALLAFGPALPGAGATWQLSESGDVVQAAARLFAGLRELDAEGRRLGLAAIAVQPVPMAGLGAAINDRLSRAAAPRG
ncbi:L-threonylcarbamoyladenylate synthase [Roseomonas sp. 18066]|uniref:L-threonylcarbamoyladenylate synthase n=1 Tax=Roseomonas sp. 18066 TaxID=2681412 RepID=UPI001357452F|nr:L-threonylcarbamoyladenylate synthase [Roseomonas sp. 18066]